MKQHRLDFHARLSALSGLLLASSLAGAQAPPPQAAKPAPAVAATATKPTTPARNSKIRSGSVFVDKAGNRHEWQINSAHTLLWEGNPYLPVGGTFKPRSLQSDSGDAWQEDTRTLDAMKAKGLHDVLIWPEKSLPDMAPVALQRLLDYLDANEFHYGLAFGPGLILPLRGTVVRPTNYRYEERNSLTAMWRVDNADAGHYFLIDAASDFRMFRTGEANVSDNVVSVPIEAPAAIVRPIALLLPHKSLPVVGKGNLPDVWTGYDGYRDGVLSVLSQVKFGPGFRFFLDPLTRHLGLSGETDYLVPDGAAFRLEWESFLTRNYGSLDDLKQAWNLLDDLKSVSDYARLIPLWANGRGFPYLFDPLTQKTYRILDQASSTSKWWDDFLRCRNEGVFYSMNALADVLKKQIADVPVVYTWTQTHPLFTNSDRGGGFDGLSVALKAQEPSRVTRTLGPAWSQAEQADRTIWFLATEVSAMPAPASTSRVTTASLPPDDGTKPAPTAPHSDLTRCLEDLRRIGSKGLFVSDVQAESGADVSDWLQSPDTLDLLHSTTIAFSPTSVKNYTPTVLLYPQANPGPAHAGMVPGAPGVFWLPSFYKGQGIDWWPSYSGYTVQRDADPRNADTVLVSLQGERKTRFYVPDTNKISARQPDGTPVPFKVLAKGIFDITLSSTPTIFQTDGQLLIPQQAAEDAIVQLQKLYDDGKVAKVPSIDSARAGLGRATDYLRQRDYNNAFTFARSELDVLTQDVRPYIWLEGETAFHNLNEVAPNPEASGGRFLRLSTTNPPGRLPYSARFTFDVPHNARYNIWVAGTPPGPDTSPITWYVNSEPEQAPASTVTQGPLYLNDRFGWYLLGTVNLEQGTRNLTFKVGGPAASGEYVFSLDAVLLTERGFSPNGTVRPFPIELSTLRAYTDQQKRAKKF